MKYIFLSYYSGLVDRGVETFVSEVASGLAKTEKVLVISGGKMGKPPFQSLVLPTKFPISFPSLFSPKLFLDSQSLLIAWFTLKALPKILAFQPDMVIPTNGRWQSLIIKIASVFFRFKMVISGQAGLGWDEKWNLLLKPDVFLALSSRNLSWAKKYAWKSQKMLIIPNGVNIAQYTQKQKIPQEIMSKYHLDTLQKPMVLCVAGKEKYKRVEETIQAVALLPKFSLIVLGGNEQTLALGIKLMGERYRQLHIAHENMRAFYQMADVFTLVSESIEAFGIAYLEAMASGLPCVATEDTLRREIIGEAGYYIEEPKDSQKYAQLIEKALNTNWGEKPLSQAKKFDWEGITLRLREITHPSPPLSGRE